ARGREWVLSTTSLRVYAFGKRMQMIAGAPGAESLLGRLLQDDTAAESELTAVYLLRSRRPEAEVEIGPEVTVGERHRRPDFRIRNAAEGWTYVEVTKLRQSGASAQTQDVLR